MISFILSSLKDWKIFFSRSRSWVVKGGWAITDQAFFSGANFLVNILLARWLPPKEYGAFVVALSVFYLLAGFHTAVITEPMMVFGAGKYREQFRKYFGMVRWGHWGVSVLIALGLGVAAWTFFQLDMFSMAEALFGLAVASPFLLLFWLTRRACYSQLSPIWAVVGSGINSVVIFSGAFLLWWSKLLSAFSGLILLGAAASIASLMLLLHFRPQFLRFTGNPTPAMVISEHRSYGSWILTAALFYSASNQVLQLLISIVLGLTASATVAAVMNLYRPINLLIGSLSLILLPTFSSWVKKGLSTEILRKHVLTAVALITIFILLYVTALTLFAKPLVNWIYAGKYGEHWELVGLIGLVTILNAIIGVFVIFLKAKTYTREVASIRALSAVISLPLAIPLMKILGIEGAFFAVIVGLIVCVIVTYRKSFS